MLVILAWRHLAIYAAAFLDSCERHLQHLVGSLEVLAINNRMHSPLCSGFDGPFREGEEETFVLGNT